MTGTVERPSRWLRIRRWFDVRFRSPSAIYGLIVFAAFVTIADDHADSPWELLINSVFPLLVFYFAHVFAHTLTDHGTHGLRRSTREAMRHGAGMLYASLPAALCLVVGGLVDASVDDASDWTVLATIAVLAVLGYNAYRRRGAGIAGRIVGAVSTTLLGVFIVILETLTH